MPCTGKGGSIEQGDVDLTHGRASRTKSVTKTDQLEDVVVVELGGTRHGMWKAIGQGTMFSQFDIITYKSLY